MTDVGDSGKDAISTLLLLGENEFMLRASPGRVLFNNYSREANFEQKITLTLDARHDDRTVSTESATVPIIFSIPSTPRFELDQASSDEAASSSSPFEFLLSSCFPRTYIIKFRPPDVSESDFVWDNFQDQLVIHTRLSRLVIPLEAWKYEVPVHARGKNLLFPVSLSNVKTPPLRRFGAIERNGDQQQHQPLSPATEPTKSTSTSMLDNNMQNSPDALPKPQAPRSEILPSLSRPAAGEQHSRPIVSSSRNLADPFSAVTAVQSQHEANEVILKLRRRRTCRSSAKVPVVTSPTSVADRELCPETVALDAKTKAELQDFNNLVTAARDHVTKQAAKAKSELAYYQQLLPTPPPIAETPASVLGSNSAAQKPRKPRQLSAVAKRPSKLPSLVRPSSGEATTPKTSANNQEASHGPVRRRVSARQLKSLSVLDNVRFKEPSKLSAHKKLGRTSTNQLQQELDTDSDPEVDEAPVMPDDLSGVATLEAGDPCF